MSISTESPTFVGPEKGRLVYSSDPEVIPGPTFEGLESLRERDPLLYADAVELAHDLAVSYQEAFLTLMRSGGYSGEVSQEVVDFIESRGMDRPRVDVLSPEDVSSLADAYEQKFGGNDWGYTPPVQMPSKDSVVVKFQLPKPVDMFWFKHDSEGVDPSPASWGALYRSLMSVPWDIVDAWPLTHPGSEVNRLNDLGVHLNGDDGFYYLFEVTKRKSDSQNESH